MDIRHLIITTPSPSGEFEATADLGPVADEAAADALLAAHTGEWYEATLCPPRAKEGDAWRPERRRFPSSKWVDVARWPIGYVSPFDRAEEIAAWLARAGVAVTWEGLRAAGPWPGRPERFPGEVEPDAWFRVAERQGRDPLETVIGSTLGEGATAAEIRRDREAERVSR